MMRVARIVGCVIFLSREGLADQETLDGEDAELVRRGHATTSVAKGCMTVQVVFDRGRPPLLTVTQLKTRREDRSIFLEVVKLPNYFEGGRWCSDTLTNLLDRKLRSIP